MTWKPLAFAAAFTVLLTSGALAERPPTTEERLRIEATLKAEGFVSWEEIEYDDDRFEVDSARHSDGSDYDLELDATTFRIIERDRED